MKASGSHQKIFVWIVLGCLALALGYTSWGILRARASARLVQVQGAPQSVLQPSDLEAIQNRPHVIYLRQEAAPYGQVNLVGLDSSSPQRSLQTDLLCDRIYYAGGNGICLRYDPADQSASDPLAPPRVWVTLFGSDFKPRHKFTVDGVLSRARVSPDGKYAAYTVFVTGHSYSDPTMSTATVLLDTATGASLGNLEEFETWKDGKRFQAPKFNFWGVTFAKDSNLFYATLRNGETTYLVQGDVAAHKFTVLHENVECPSLSPDGTRIAFKKVAPGLVHRWQLTVLDLATMKETELVEKEGIDDQVEWLDNDHILYQKSDYDPPKWVSVFVLPADGSGKPQIFIPNATSPVVVHSSDTEESHAPEDLIAMTNVGSHARAKGSRGAELASHRRCIAVGAALSLSKGDPGFGPGVVSNTVYIITRTRSAIGVNAQAGASHTTGQSLHVEAQLAVQIGRVIRA